MACTRTSRMLLALTALLLWSSVLAGCALFRSAGEDGPNDVPRAPQADTLADSLVAADVPLDSARGDSVSDTVAVRDTTAARGATDSLAGLAAGRPPALSNDSLRRITPGDTIPTGAGSTGGQQRVDVQADSLTERAREGLRIQQLMGNVFVRQDSTRLRSQNAVRFLERDEFLFTGRVVIFERGDTLRADTVRYDRQAKVGRAFGRVHLSDGDVDLYSTRAVYYTDEKRSVFPDSVMLVDDEQTLTARSGSYLSDTQQADFYGDVRVRTPDSYMEADTVTYLRQEEQTNARGDVFIDRSPRASARRAPLGGESGRFGRLAGTEGDDASSGPTPEASDEEAGGDEADDQTLLFGDRVDNDERAKTSLVVGRALLIQIRRDSAGTPTDTLMVQSHRLFASRTDTLNRMIAVDTVRIWQSDLAAVGDSVVYDRLAGPDDSSSIDSDAEAPTHPTAADPTAADSVTVNVATDVTAGDALADSDTTEGEALDHNAVENNAVEQNAVEPISLPSDSLTVPRVPERPASLRDTTSVDTTSVDTSFAERTASSEGTGARKASDAEEGPMREETRLFQEPVAWFDGSQVSGDTLRVVVRDRSIDTVFVRSNAFAAQRDTSLDRIQQLSGRRMTAVFRRDSIRQIIAFPNARSIRFLKDKGGKPNGGARSSADRIILRFQDGDVRRVSFLGGTQTTYYKQPIVPSPFELEGFLWTPNARPKRASFLQQDRVKRRLEGPTGDPPIVQAPDARSDTSSGAVGATSRTGSGAEPAAVRSSTPEQPPSGPPSETSQPPDEANDERFEE